MIRCPSCGAGQLATRTTCSNCQGSLTEIVVGYKDRLALAMDRDQLEEDGWKLIEAREDVEGSPFSARFRRDVGVPPKPVRQRGREEQPSSGGAQYWVLALLVVITIGAAIGVVLRLRSYEGSNAAADATPQIANLSVEGGPGVLFDGAIADGTASRKISGAVPQSFDLESAVAYSIVIQKNATDLSLLQITLTCGNGTSFTSSTTQPSGVLAMKSLCK